MKKHYCLLVMLFIVSSISAQYTAIPDANFEAAIEAIITDDASGDGQVPTSEIETITALDVRGLNISDLTGVEDFIALEQLYFSDNDITSIDLTNLVNLQTLWGFANNLTTLDLSNNLALADIRMEENQLTSLDLSAHTNLVIIQLNANQLKVLDVSNSPSITRFRVYDNKLSTLDLSNNPALQEVRVSENELYTFNIQNGNNTNISNFSADTNFLTCILVDDATYSTTNWTTIDSTTSFSDMYCEYTTIPDANFEAALDTLGHDDISGDGQVPTALIEVVTSLDISAKSIEDLTGIEDFLALETLNVSNNNLTALDVSNNVNLIELTIDDNINLTSLNVSGCTLLERISTTNNAFSTIDLSANTTLNTLSITDNTAISSVDLTYNALLKSLSLKNLDNLTAVDVSNNTSIDTIQVTNNTKLSLLNVKNGANTDIIQFVANNNDSLTCILVDDATYSTSNWGSIDSTARFSDTYCDYTAIPDANFEAALETLGYDDISGDGQVPTALIEAITSLDISGKSINDLTGIEAFTALVTLIAGTNNLSSLDLSGNVNLETVQCSMSGLTSINIDNLTNLKNLTLSNNALTALDVSALTALEILVLQANSLTSIDVSKNTNLTSLSLSENQLTSLDVSANTALQDLILSDNAITAIDVSHNTELVWLYAQNTSLTTIDLTNNTLLEKLWVNDNQLTSLDVSNNILLTELGCYNNTISLLDVSENTALSWLLVYNNSLISLKVQNGNNTNIANFNATNNNDLTCILVDDAAYSTTNWTTIDNQTSFNDDYCEYTIIPDANFEAVLYDLGYDDVAGDQKVPTANIIAVTELDVNSEAISDLTGIENFRALEELKANNNSMASIDLSKNIALKLLYINNNNLTHLELSENTNLEELSINDLNFNESIDLSNNTKLIWLSAENYNQGSIDLSNNIAIENLDLEGSLLATLDVSALTKLITLNLSSTQISNIDLSQNLMLQEFYFSECDFTNLDFSGLSNLKIVNGTSDNLATVNLEGVSALESFQLNSNVITALDLSDAINLDFLSVINGQLGDIDLSNNIALTRIQLLNTNPTSLDLRNIDLTQITLFNISTGDALSCISVSDVDYAENNFNDYFEYSLHCGYTAIPDANFEAALENLGYDDISGDGLVPTALIEDITNLSVVNESITDFTGIEDFAALTTLVISENTITTLDLSNNINLQILEADNAGLTSLNISQNSNLEELSVHSNALIDLDTSNNPALKSLIVSQNQITSMDVVSNTTLERLEVNDNELTKLNVKNGNNSAILTFDATNNPDLFCIRVDDVSFSTSNWTNIDEQITFSEAFCRYTAIPDANFEAALSTYDDIANDGQVPTENIEGVTLLIVSSNSISDLTGIEDFTNLDRLFINSNTISTLDLSNNVNLTELYANSNTISSINLSNNTELTDLYIENNNLSSIDISNNVKLEVLQLEGNTLSSIDLSNNVLVKELDLNDNNLTTLDLSTLTLLENAFLEGNSFSNLDVSNNAVLYGLYMDDNPQITALDFSNLEEFGEFSCNNCTALAEATFENNPILGEVYVDNTQVTSLNLSVSTIVYEISIRATGITYLDLSHLTNLNNFYATDAQLESLNLKSGGNTNIIDLDLTGNSNLTCVLVDDASYSTTNWTTVDDQTLFSDVSCDSAPTAVCQSITVQLDETGSASITADDIDNGSTDDGTIVSKEIDIETFDCSDIGEHTVTLIVTDNGGNTDSCTAIVTVQDTIAPEFETATLPADTNVAFNNAGGDAYILEDYISGINYTDNCNSNIRGIRISQDPVRGTELTQGDHQITITATDKEGNDAIHTFTVRVSQTLNTERNTIAGLSVYPIPAEDVVYFGVTVHKVVVTNITGQTIIEAAQTSSIRVEDLREGIYFLQLTKGNKHDVVRFIKRNR